MGSPLRISATMSFWSKYSFWATAQSSGERNEKSYKYRNMIFKKNLSKGKKDRKKMEQK